MVKTPLLLPSDRRDGAAAFPPGRGPRRDYRELAHALGHAPLLLPDPGGGLSAKLERRTATDLRQAIEAARRFRSVSVYISFSEKVGLPLALLLAARRLRIPHVLVAHRLTSVRKRALQTRLDWLRHFARIVVVAEPQAAYLKNVAGYPAERIALLPDAVDLEFWRPEDAAPAPPAEPFLLSVGRERRDHATLAAAARELAPQKLVTVASSRWDGDGGALLPFRELRSLYQQARVVVVPLQRGTRYAAGANGLLEGMAMGRPVVVTRTPGLSWYAADRQTARVVPPGDPAALADAIRELLADPAEAARLGQSARHAAEAWHGLEGYVAALARVAREAAAEGAAPAR